MAARDIPSPRAVALTVLTAVLVVLALYLIYLLRKPIGWLLIATFLAIALSGPVNVLNRHMKRGFAITLVYLGLMLVPVGIGAIVVPPIVNGGNDLAENAPDYAQDVTDFVNDNETLRDINEDYDVTEKIEEEAAKLPSKIDDAAVVLRDVGFGLVSSLFALVTILILTAFILGGGRRWLHFGLRFVPEDRAERLERVFDRVGRAVGNYVAGALAQATIAGVTAYIVLQILGVPFAAPLALIIFFLDLIPLVGATIGAVLVGRGHAVPGLPDRHDHLGDLLDRLPAAREQPDPAADPEARGGDQPLPGDRLRPLRQRAARDDRRARGRAGRRVDPDRRARVHGLQGDRAAARARGRATAPPPPEAPEPAPA